jgi:membrane protease YdiL (CAAX protease family)
MNQTKAFLKRHSLVLGIALMFLLTWPIDLANNGLMPFQVPFIVYIFLGWGIVFASIIMTGLTLGKEGVVTLLKRYLLWRVGWKWYLTVFLLPAALVIPAVYINAALTGVAPDYSTVMAHKIFGASANLLLFILPWFLYEIVTNGEEIGWRGYVLPRLQAKHSALISTLILGVIWGFWHLPKFLPDFDMVHFAWFMVHVMAMSVILTWIYNGTRGSLLLVVLYHASINTVTLFVPIANTQSNANMGSYISYVLLELVTAVIIVIITGPARLSRTQPKQVQE